MTTTNFTGQVRQSFWAPVSASGPSSPQSPNASVSTTASRSGPSRIVLGDEDDEDDGLYTLTHAEPGGQLRQDDTFARLLEAASEDVVMRDATGAALYIVVDTNALIDQYPALDAFMDDVETNSIPAVVIVPEIVLTELDGLKNRDGVKWFARQASTVLWKHMRKAAKLQTRSESTGFKSLNGTMRNDMAIYDCCLFFRTKGSVVLLSSDVNLCLYCQNDGIATIRPPNRSWSSQEMAKDLHLYSEHLDPALFRRSTHGPQYRPTKSRAHGQLGRTEAPAMDEDDRMDVDEDTAEDEFVPSHAWDSLHVQVINYYSVVLKEVAERVRVASGDNGPPSKSQYAPAYRRKVIEDWTLRDCLEYLGSKKQLLEVTPPLSVFLLRRNEDRGWRRGQDWPSQAWQNALAALKDIGTQFGEGVVLDSVEDVRQHVQWVFSIPMRPTGL
ncbi:hypothetical protein K474DRAFT_1768312 [Panus rudis PR-1116 ss-1]|nr:hypothetical protein K474DRAFT_1768312 [Panus rudis PR-1116 ss-1]